MRKFGVFIAFMVLISSCDNAKAPILSEGIWLGELEVQDNEILPFNFEFKKSDSGQLFIEIYNAAEVIKVEEVTLKNDSIVIRTPVYKGYIAGKFIKESLERIVPFKAIFGKEERFSAENKPQENV